MMAVEKKAEAKIETARSHEMSGPQRLLSTIGRIMPRSIVRGVEKNVMAAGINLTGEVMTGIYLLVPILLFIITAAALYTLKFSNLLIIAGAVAVPLIVLAVLYQIIHLRVDERRDKVELLLPDFLSLAAANIRAGMQLDKALWYAAKPEFEILSHEVELASKRVFSGETLDRALDELSARFESRYLTRTIDLIKEGEISGGEMANILEKTAMDLRDLQIMRKEVSASMVMYSIFIGFSAAIGAPFLYVVSSRLIIMFEQLWSRKQVEATSTAVQGVSTAAPGLSSSEFSLFAVLFIVVTAVIATAMISVIQTGSKRNALKYILPFLVVALAVFYIGGKVLGLLFGAVTL